MSEDLTRITVSYAGKDFPAIEVTDARGRKIVVRRMSVLERFRFKKLIPAGIGDVTFWFGDAMTAASVYSVDGLPCIMPTNEAGVERMIEMLDEDGMTAVAPAVQDLLMPSHNEAEAAKN